MTYKDIYIKLLIEYDKANVTSSYPSLTEYEFATILDKAYLALIAQKLTGNNLRQIGFEGDIKAIEDIQPLIVSEVLSNGVQNDFIKNQYDYQRPEHQLYYITGLLKTDSNVNAIDKQGHVTLPVHLVSHENAKKFMISMNNMPWIPEPVCYEGGDIISVLVDSYQISLPAEALLFRITYIKEPIKFVSDDLFSENKIFELGDSMAEELINLAISMALETAESTRLSTKLQTRQLEA